MWMECKVVRVQIMKKKDHWKGSLLPPCLVFARKKEKHKKKGNIGGKQTSIDAP